MATFIVTAFILVIVLVPLGVWIKQFEENLQKKNNKNWSNDKNK